MPRLIKVLVVFIPCVTTTALSSLFDTRKQAKAHHDCLSHENHDLSPYGHHHGRIPAGRFWVAIIMLRIVVVVVVVVVVGGGGGGGT